MVDGCIYYQVDPRRQLNGRTIGGKREAFLKKKEALEKADAIATETKLDGSVTANMDAELRVMALKGQAILKPFGKTLSEAVDFFKEFLLAEQAKEESQTVTAMVDLWKNKKTAARGLKVLRQATIDDIKETSKILKREFGKYRILEINKKHFEEYFDKIQVGQRRKFNLRSRFSQFFNWCINEHEISIKNPLEKITIDVPEKEVPVLKPIEAERIMRLCQSRYPQLIAYHAVSLFGGLRPTEALYLCWKDIHIDEDELQVKADISKTKRTRSVPINETLKAWLAHTPLSKEAGIVPVLNERELFEKFRAELGYKIRGENPNGKKWPEDILRHTFATYWLKKYNQDTKTHNNKYALADIMGNSPKIIEDHYKAIVKNSEAEKYWKILP
jgi:integrase